MYDDMYDVLVNRPILPLLALAFGIMAGLCPASRRRGGMKKNLRRCLAAAFLLGAAIATDYLVVDVSNWSTTFEPLLCFADTFLLGWLVFRMKAEEGVFTAVWAQILSELLMQALIPSVFVYGEETAAGALLHLGLSAVFAAAAFFLVRRLLFPYLARNGEYTAMPGKTTLCLTVLTLFLVLSNYQVIFWLLTEPPEQGIPMIPAFRLLAGFCALFALYLQNAAEKRFADRRELEIARQLHVQREEQYRISSENIALINNKCHDLKHQIAALRTLRSTEEFERQIEGMERAVMIYDSAVKTGNAALDIVLTEKSLFCEANGVSMTCLVDGSALDFVEIVDLYSMFGNALDNAIESVMKEEASRRVIQVAGYREKGFLLIRVRNFVSAPPPLVDGLPKTTKADKDVHGFGLRSIRSTAEKYGGGITVETGFNFFALQILLPIPAERLG